MKQRKKVLVFFAVLTALCVMLSANLASFDTVLAEGGSSEVLFDGDSFVGVKVDKSMEGSVYFGLKPRMSPIADMFGMAEFVFDSPIDTSAYTGLYIKVQTPPRNNYGFHVLLKDSEGNYWTTCHGGSENRNDPFILDNGTVTHMQKVGGQEKWNGDKTGTWYIPFSGVYGSIKADGTNYQELTAIPSGTEIASVAIGLVMTKVDWYAGYGFSVSAAGAVKVGADAASSEITTLFDASTLTNGFDPEDTTKDINVADVSKGNKVRVYLYHPTQTPNIVTGDNAELGLSNCLLKRADVNVKVNCKDSSGEAIRDPFVVPGYFDNATGVYSYTINAPVIAGWTLTNPEALDGTCNTVGHEVNLVYTKAYVITLNLYDETETHFDTKIVNVPYETAGESVSYTVTPPVVAGYRYVSADRDLSVNISSNIAMRLNYEEKTKLDYEVLFGEFGFDGVNIKNSMSNAFRMSAVSKEEFTPTNTSFGVVGFSFKPVSVSENSGLLVKLSSPAIGIRVWIETDDGSVYRCYDGNARSDICVYEDGQMGYWEDTGWAHLFDKDHPTLTAYLPWNIFIDSKTTASLDPNDISKNVVRFMVGVDMRNSYFSDKSITVGHIAAVKVGEDAASTVVTKLLSTGDLVYSDSQDAEGHVNTADITAGTVIAPYYAIAGGFTVNSVPGDTTIAVSNFLFGQRYSEITVNVVDEDGDFIDENNFTVYCDNNGNYEITPPTLFGWEYSESSAPLTGSANEDMEVTLTYKMARHNVTIKFVDGEGKSIREDLIKEYEYKDIYQIDDSEIEVKGYSFVESSRTLKGTVMGDMTITLTYAKSGGCSSGNSTMIVSLLGGLALVLGKIFLRRK